MRRWTVVLFTFILALGCLGGVGCKRAEPDIPEEDPADYRIRTADLRETDAYQERWLTIPNSRLVVNPFSFSDYVEETDVTQAEHSNRPIVPLNLGYLDPNSHKELGKNTTVANLLMVLENQASARVESTSLATAWQPDRLDFSARYAEGLQAAGTDYFYDEKTVVRRVEASGGKLSIAGNLPGSATFRDDVLLVENARYRLAIAFGMSPKLTFYANGGEMFNKGKERARPVANGSWAFDFEGETSIDVAVAVDALSASNEEVAALARAPFAHNNVNRRLAERTKAWNQFFDKIPFTGFTDMPKLEFAGAEKGVTAEDVRHEYYLAWALIWSGVLPPNDELGYPYHQVTCGKPSMWDEGEPRASHSASWESFFGIQYLSFVDPETAWSAYRGMMSLVDEEGILGGESLPPENAHTAWILHQNQPNAEALREIYPALKRHLTWRFRNPRWILNEHNFPDEKDYDFCSMFMMDADFAKLICEEIGKAEDAAYWEDLQAQMYANIKTWFYRSERANPYQYYFTGDGRFNTGARAWVVKSLWMNALDGEYLTRTLNYAQSGYNINTAFSGLSAVKYDSFAYTAQGLIRHGATERGTQLLEMGMRDIVLSKFIAEAYYPDKAGIVAENGVSGRGVRPSLFGASILIESVWQTNGFVRYWGGAAAVNLYDRVSTVERLTIGGKKYALTVDGLNGTVTLVREDGKRLQKSAPRGVYVRLDLAALA